MNGKGYVNTIPSIWDHEKEVISLFPEMIEEFRKAHEEIDKPGCSGCKRNKYKQTLYKRLIAKINLNPDKDISILKPLSKELNFFQRFVNKPRKPDTYIKDIKTFDDLDIQRIERYACMECTGKHLAQAYVLMKETQQGYPEHIEYAQRHVEEAKRMTPHDEARILELGKMLAELEKQDNPTAEHLKQVYFLLEEELKELDPNRGLSVWIAIGHLAEASDECVHENPDFANEIRNERLKLMADHNADIPVRYLLNKAKALNEQEQI
jgi:hypothetical protein